MKINFFKYLIIILSCIVFLSSTVLSQSLSDKQKKEHDAVKNLLYSKVPNFGSNSNTPNLKNGTIDNELNLSKIQTHERRKSFFMNGNKISSDIYNYGGIGPGFGLLRGINNFVWNDQDYVFQFGPIVGASVPNSDNTGQIHIISDGLNDYTSPNLIEANPDRTVLWQWQPLPGYSDPNSDDMASNPAEDTDGDGKPDSWPREWYNETLGKYVWPGYLSQDATNADLEVFWAMDDRDNLEFPYYPFPSDSLRKGLGLQIDGRAFQWSNALAENTIFFVYTITNISEKDLDSVFFGIYGDPDLGGGTPENTDDNGKFVPPYSTPTVNVDQIPVYARSMVYFFDPDMKGRLGLPLGYLGCKYLESPGNPNNGIDDDGDGMFDESQEDGIDNDGDWNAAIHDVGIDGIINTTDEGEGDGVPTAGKKLSNGSLDPLYPGEPNYELTDLDEADQIGLTSFNSWSWSTDKISNDESMWNRSRPRNFGDIQQDDDITFIFASGYISLKKGETKRISMALLCGHDLDDLLTSAETVQTIYNQNYQFFKPPVLPTVTAVPDDKKVTLYWDTKAEESIDPITGKDFQGYVIYRSTDPSFSDIQIITDGKGSSFLSDPLKGVDGFEAKFDLAIIDEPYTDLNANGKYDSGEPYKDFNHDNQYSFNIEDPWKGYHPVAYQGRGIQYYLGNNNGLVHSFVDSNNVINGQTYYYAIVAYDNGDSLGIPVTETTKKITLDPITSKYRFDPNTAQVIPGPRASGYELNYRLPASPGIGLMHDGGIGTGDVLVEVLDDLAIPDKGGYQIFFKDSITINNITYLQKNYSILKSDPVEETFPLYDTKFTKLKHSNLLQDGVVVTEVNSDVAYPETGNYVLDYSRGSIRRTDNSTMPNGGTFEITYHYYPVYQSTNLNLEDDNSVFDGLVVKVRDEKILEVDTSRTNWISGETNFKVLVQKAARPNSNLYPADYEIHFSNTNIDSALMLAPGVPGGIAKFPVKYSVTNVTTGVPEKILTFLNENITALKDSAWSPGEEIILFKPGSPGLPTDFTWGVILTLPDTPAVPVSPVEGENVLYIHTFRPFNKADQFSFEVEGAKYNSDNAKDGLENVYVVPNPYIGVNEIEPTTKLPGQQRGERRIYFENLPPKCTIRIYTLSGEHVQTIEHETTLQNAREYWNLLNRDGFGVAYGIYFAHVDAPGVGEKLIKFALIK